MESIEEKQRAEINYWRDSEHESPKANSVYNVVNKLSDSAVFLDLINRLGDQIRSEGRVLELGGGQGWASCLYKRLFPKSHVTLTDISEHAISSLNKWERLWETKIDCAYCCKSYKTREDDSSIDIVFCFASAHHFLAHRRTLQEIHRILKPNSKAFYLYESSSPKFWYPIVYKRVNRKRPSVPEDVLRTSEIQLLANEIGLDLHLDYYPSIQKRDPIETIYFFLLNKIPVLQKILPCTVNFVFKKV